MDKFLYRPIRIQQNYSRGALLVVLLVLCACSQKNVEFTVTLGGDVMLARAGEPIFSNANGSINPWSELETSGIYAPPSKYSAAFFLVNLESPLGEISSTTGEMNLCSNPAEVKILQEAQVSLVSLMNNHKDDCQMIGETQTQEILSQKDIHFTLTDYVPIYLDTPQGKIGVIAAEDITAPVDIDALLLQIREAKKSAQTVIVSMHWGNEYQAGADERQQVLAQQIADAGGDIIWGHHPHVLQRLQWIQADDNRHVLVLYSLGNLLSDQWILEDAQRSALVRLSFRNGEIIRIEILPVMMKRSTKMLELVTDQEIKGQITDRLGVEALARENVEVIIH